MPNYGLGRGLESLIPSLDEQESQKKSQKTSAVSTDSSGSVSSPRVPRTRHQSRPIQSQELSEVPLTSETQVSKTGVAKKEFAHIPVDKVRANPHQPRKNFNPLELAEMAESVRRYGVMQPIVVTETSDGYELIAGERRLQASRIVGLPTIPAVIRKPTAAKDKLELALVENVHRSNLNSMEKARAFSEMIRDFGLTQEQVGKRMGKSRVYVTNMIRLLDLPEEMQQAIEKGILNEAQGRALLMFRDPAERMAMFQRVVREKMPLHVIEKIASAKHVDHKKYKRSTADMDPEMRARQETLQKRFGTKVSIVTYPRAKKGGKIVIEYFSPEDLDNLYQMLSQDDGSNTGGFSI